MQRTRRQLLAGLALGAGSLAGCVSRPSTDGDDTGADVGTDPPGDAPQPTDTATATATDETTPATSTGTDTGPVRPDGDPITAERTVTDPELEYLPEQDAVKYPSVYRRTGRGPEGQPTRTTIYETKPFEDWAVTECAMVGAEAIGRVVDSQVDGDPNFSAGLATRDEQVILSASLVTMKNREGEVISESTVPFDRIVAVTPRSVTATVHLDGQSHTATVPVWVEESTVRYD